jgi:redox-sensitive bicupin YhaK (pirin superfamily)
MTAGRGITHSERTSAETRAHPHSLYGIQTWLALPEALEDTDAAFEHRREDELPLLEAEGKQLRLILGNGWGAKAPVGVASEMFYADAILAPGARLPMPDDHEDRGIYILEGEIAVAGQSFARGQMMVFRPGDRITVTAGPHGARLILLGGATMGAPRYIWWNFVASSKEKIEAAKEAWAKGDWEHGRFQLPPGDEADFIPLPER